jgi:diguanylate cyclase (GGDEF)-like protein/PAS domain S-box-containing protein
MESLYFLRLTIAALQRAGGRPGAFLLAVGFLGCAGSVLWLRGKTKAQPHESFPGELQMLRAVVANLPDSIYVKDANSRFLLANQGVARLMGADSPEELTGKTDFDYYPQNLAAGFYEDEQRVIATGEPLRSQNEQLSEEGERGSWVLTTKVPLRDARGKPVGIIGIGRDITALKEAEAELERARENLHYKATHDSLTALLNREAILDMLAREAARSARQRAHAAVLLADLDHFKQINDTLGHPVGDQVLQASAARLAGAVRAYDLVGRYGGEEFLILLSGCSASGALDRAEELRRSMESTPVETTAGAVSMTVSVGVLALQDWGYPSPDVILRQVDSALYAAKAAGRNCCMAAQAQPALR